MSQYVTVPGWRRAQGHLSGGANLSHRQGIGLGQDGTDLYSFGDPFSDPTVTTPSAPLVLSSSVNDAPYAPAPMPVEPWSTAPASTAGSGLQTLWGPANAPVSSNALQTVNWGNGVTGTYEAGSNTFYDSNGNPLTGAELQQYGAFTLGAPGSASGIASIGSGIASAISKIFSPSPSAGVPARPGVATASISSSLGSSLSSLLLPIAAIAVIALVVKRR
jgi:hypothetical protein